MDLAIVSIAEIQRDHANGIPLADCIYHTWTPAFATHAAEYRRLDALARPTPSHDALAARRRVDRAQAGEPC